MNLVVTLTIGGDPEVTVTPEVDGIAANTNETLTWVPAVNQTFTFTSLTGLNNPPFGTPNVQNTQITVSDNNTLSSVGLHAYTLVVTQNGSQHNSTSRQNVMPRINNK